MSALVTEDSSEALITPTASSPASPGWPPIHPVFSLQVLSERMEVGRGDAAELFVKKGLNTQTDAGFPGENNAAPD